MPSKGSEPNFLARNFPLLLLVGALALALAGWSIFWYAASLKAESVLTAWMEREAQVGRNWICPDRRGGGYPFEIEISCVNPLFQSEILGKKFTGTLRGFHAAAPLLRPETIIAELDPPFTAKTSDGTLDVILQWGHLGLELVNRPERLARAALIGEQVTLQGKIGDISAITGGVGSFNGFAVSTPGRQDNAYDFRLAVNDALFPALASALGLQAPMSISVDGMITQADFSGAGKFEDRIERWRKTSGQIELKSARMTSGRSEFDAEGNLGLDDEHRIRGALDATIAGLDTALVRLGVDPATAAAGALVTSLMAHAAMPLTLADGWVSIGPLRTPVRLPPLY
jgi:hypothetical protein